jgi:type II secretory pathway pseudopilin PulG
MHARLRDESGFGLLELLIAMVILNVGLFAIVGAFNGATVAISRAATVSAATAVADKQMEIYRSLENCAIWLDPQSFPVKDSGSFYQADTSAWQQVPPINFFDKSADPAAQDGFPWATWSTSSASYALWSGDIPGSCVPAGTHSPINTTPTPGNPINPVTPPATAVLPIQAVPGLPSPDGTPFPVYTYITIVQPAAGTYVKKVTIVVRDPKDITKILARETSLFDPQAAK